MGAKGGRGGRTGDSLEEEGKEAVGERRATRTNRVKNEIKSEVLGDW